MDNDPLLAMIAFQLSNHLNRHVFTIVLSPETPQQCLTQNCSFAIEVPRLMIFARNLLH